MLGLEEVEGDRASVVGFEQLASFVEEFPLAADESVVVGDLMLSEGGDLFEDGLFGLESSIAGLLLGMAMFSVGHGVHTFGYAEILGRPVDLDWADDLRYVVGAIASTFLALVGLVLVFRSEAHDLK